MRKITFFLLSFFNFILLYIFFLTYDFHIYQRKPNIAQYTQQIFESFAAYFEFLNLF